MIAAMVFSLTACGGAQPGNGSTAAGGKDDIYNNEYAGEFIWTRENNVSGWADLMAGQEKELTEEEMIYFSPAVATPEQLKGLPEAIILVGSLDLFCDEDMDYAKKLMEAGKALLSGVSGSFPLRPVILRHINALIQIQGFRLSVHIVKVVTPDFLSVYSQHAPAADQDRFLADFGKDSYEVFFCDPEIRIAAVPEDRVRDLRGRTEDAILIYQISQEFFRTFCERNDRFSVIKNLKIPKALNI